MHHGVYGKGNATLPLNMFDESVKVPCIASQPGRIPEGVVQSPLVSQYDFMPTLLEYIGVNMPPDDRLPGKSFANALLGNQPESEHEHVVVYDEYGPVRMVRTEDWKYVHRYPDGPNELYNLSDDPGEQSNLADLPEHSSRQKEMRERLEDWMKAQNDQGEIFNKPYPLSGPKPDKQSIEHLIQLNSVK